MTNWEREKAYCKKRAEALGREMDEAIAENDRDRFDAAYSTAMRYMNKKERDCYYRRFLERRVYG